MTITTENAVQEAAAILGKVQALLAKTVDNGCTEAEASAAAGKVQALLAKHNLNLAALQNQQAPVYETREKTDSGKSAMFAYQKKLMECIAHNNFCMAFVREDGRKREHQLLGRKVNVTVSVQTYDYLCQAMARLNPYRHDRKNAIRFMEGCAERLVERLNAQRYEAEQESKRAKAEAQQTGNGTDLIVLSDVYGSEEELNCDALYGYEPGTTARRNREYANRRAAEDIKYAADKRKEDELVAGGMNRRIAWYVARGYEIPADVMDEPKAETRREREARERRSERLHAKWDREWQREQARKNSAAYQSGRMTAEEISLNQQIEKSDRTAIE